jgi:hypothetical protein
MKKLILVAIFSLYLQGSTQQDITNKQVNDAMKLEKKYAKEQKFYQGDEYDLKGCEINKESLKHIEVMEPEDDFDMDSVYD